MKKYVFYLLTLSLALFVTFFSRAKIDQANQTLQLSKSTFLPSPHTARLMSLGFDQILADFYWLQFVGYVGDLDNRKLDRYALADQYLDLITGLDPYFVQAYWFAAFTVGSDQHRPQRAAELLERGIQANPDNWYLPFIAGNNQFLYANNGLAAAKYYRMASKFPGAPDWLERQANILETNTPLLIKQAYSWLNIFNSAEESMVKEHAREQCIRLWVQVFKHAPSELYRGKAREALRSCGVDVDAVVRGHS